MTCSYLCKSSFECSLKKGGVIVPLPDHFEQFCLTGNFINCRYFREAAIASGLAPPSTFRNSSSAPSSERRVFIRKKAKFSVTLSSYESERPMRAAIDLNAIARTVDFSQGGMRVQAPKMVAKDGVVLFNFGEGFIAPFLHGLADVCWQKNSVDKGLWEAGLSFKEQFVKAVIAVQMSS